MTGTLLLLRFALRRDRVKSAVWVVAIATLVAVSAGSVIDLYRTDESRLAYAALVDGNAALIVQSGPGYGLDDPSVGAILMNELSIWTIIGVSIMSIFAVTRHTRAEEESERADLVRSLPLGRQAPAAAAFAGALVADIAVAAAVVAVLLAAGLELTGSIAFGACLVGAGATFAAVASVMAHVTTTSRSANGSSLAVLAAAFIIRAIGDVAGDTWLSALSWVSPIGAAQAIRAFADERWWTLSIPLASSSALLGASALLTTRRDIGRGLLGERPGRAEAAPQLDSPLALALRLQRPMIAGWSVGAAVLGLFYGIVADQIEQMLIDSPEIADFLAQAGGASIVDAYLATATLMLGLLTAAFVTAAMLRLHGEERAGRVDPILAAPVTRRTWALSHLRTAVAGAAVVSTSAGAATGLGASLALSEPERLSQSIPAALSLTPAAAVIGAIAFLLATALPRWALASWAAVAVAVVVGLLGDLLDLPSAVRALSPYHHLAAMPAEPFAVLPALVCLAVSVALVAIGLARLDRRDLSRST